MDKRKSIIGLSLLCALVVSAIAAQGASAGTTLFTCVPDMTPGVPGFSKEHCAPADAVPTERIFKHEVAEQGKTTEVKATTTDTEGAHIPSILKATIGGIAVELEATLIHLENGSLTNILSGKEHYFSGKGKLKFTGVKVKAPAGKGCEVEGGEFGTNNLNITTQGLEEEVEFSPETEAGGVIASFKIKGCAGSKAIEVLNGLYELKGSAKCKPSGATLNCIHAAITAQGTLTLRGQKAGLESSLTLEAKPPLGMNWQVLSPTVVNTP